ncbi:hypothetical protein BJF92_14315 [Rhizobium rhizosphaerae]|uniref:General secretion pathway protein J n=1 Tax=Xaviernesmea rhizosphaerae TaxID=1672749 RepID=A0A1Q9AID1_9HYPH|nr:hypothetical protein [Xaviernesmea rhizosphaerae]OLP54956.1 hypothetical protein BJF92_14315 [Xaviernesmea rhizosphaerae]
MRATLTGAVRPARQRAANAGFLLVEALTAMAIGALLLLALASLLSLVLRASDRTTAAGTAVEERARIVSALIARIEPITPQRWAGPGAGFVFEGTETMMLFARFRAGRDGILQSRLVRLASAGQVLSEDERPLPPDARDSTAVTGGDSPVVLQDRFVVRFAYFSRLADGTEALTDRWSATTAMPVAIRVTLADPDGTPRGSVRIPLRVNAEPGCAAPGPALCSLAPRAAAPGPPPESQAPNKPDDSGG